MRSGSRLIYKAGKEIVCKDTRYRLPRSTRNTACYTNRILVQKPAAPLIGVILFIARGPNSDVLTRVHERVGAC
jgi:hypothetical protein